MRMLGLTLGLLWWAVGGMWLVMRVFISFNFILIRFTNNVVRI